MQWLISLIAIDKELVITPPADLRCNEVSAEDAYAIGYNLRDFHIGLVN